MYNKTEISKVYEYYFFDLYFTLFNLRYDSVYEKNEYGLLGITQNEWDAICRIDYSNRATGSIHGSKNMVESLIKLADPEASDELINKATEIRLKRYRNASLEIYPSIIDTLSKLKKMNKKIVLISNADYVDKKYFNDSPIAKFFDSVIFSFDVGHLKPEKEIFEQAIKSVNADISKSLFIGDGGHNELKGAKKIGFDTVLTTQIITDLWPERIKSLALDADYVVEDLSNLINNN